MLTAPMASAIEWYDFFILQFDSRTSFWQAVFPLVLVVHVDETTINIQGVDHYVWVFTDGSEVVFKMTETREATIVHECLVDYQGILISESSLKEPEDN
jgi:hypothetical protein